MGTPRPLELASPLDWLFIGLLIELIQQYRACQPVSSQPSKVVQLYCRRLVNSTNVLMAHRFFDKVCVYAHKRMGARVMSGLNGTLEPQHRPRSAPDYRPWHRPPRLESPPDPRHGGTGRRSHRIRPSEICVKNYGCLYMPPEGPSEEP